MTCPRIDDATLTRPISVVAAQDRGEGCLQEKLKKEEEHRKILLRAATHGINQTSCRAGALC